MSFWKAPRGSYVLERDEQRANDRTKERDEKAKAKRRDGRCRWPMKHVCRGGLESAHIRDASLGGEMDSSNLVTLCAWIHRRGPESIHGKQLRIDPVTSAGANGPLIFWRRDEEGQFYVVAQERAIGIIQRD